MGIKYYKSTAKDDSDYPGDSAIFKVLDDSDDHVFLIWRKYPGCPYKNIDEKYALGRDLLTFWLNDPNYEVTIFTDEEEIPDLIFIDSI